MEHHQNQNLKTILKSIEKDGKELPILLKHYQKLGANFHSLAIDKNFNDTPGLLLSVDIPNLPTKQSTHYFGDNWKDYLNHTSE